MIAQNVLLATTIRTDSPTASQRLRGRTHIGMAMYRSTLSAISAAEIATLAFTGISPNLTDKADLNRCVCVAGHA